VGVPTFLFAKLYVINIEKEKYKQKAPITEIKLGSKGLVYKIHKPKCRTI